MNNSTHYIYFLDLLYAVNGPSAYVQNKALGFTLNPNNGKLLETWSPHSKVN